ncbi:MAG: dephospho-CoA kinase [Actinobacteria bacterium]|nr:dephospho-CoA kinase [Actinomycetota bacterium]
MRVVGLTGGIGSGKSLVGEFFAQLGAQVLDADDLARKAIERGTFGFEEVIARFGDEILKNGDIDRRVLGEKIFGNANKKKQLESIIHPLVKSAFDAATVRLGEDDIVVYEVPLIFEAQVQNRFDYIITVESEIVTRLERLKNRGLTRAESEARISAQATPLQRRTIADYVIENDGSREDLLREVEHLWTDVLPGIGHRKR